MDLYQKSLNVNWHESLSSLNFTRFMKIHVKRHFTQYFSRTVSVIFTGGWNWSIQRTTNLITWLYQVHFVIYRNQILLVIINDYQYKSRYLYKRRYTNCFHATISCIHYKAIWMQWKNCPGAAIGYDNTNKHTSRFCLSPEK